VTNLSNPIPLNVLGTLEKVTLSNDTSILVKKEEINLSPFIQILEDKLEMKKKIIIKNYYNNVWII
jgi:hypothetical protein